MLTRVGMSTNFGSTIVKNQLYNDAIEQTSAHLEKGNDLRHINAFLNAVSYLKQDGRDDVYEIVKEKGNGYNSRIYRLLKNGEQANEVRIGRSDQKVRDLFIGAVYNKLDSDVFANAPINLKKYDNALRDMRMSKWVISRNNRAIDQKVDEIEELNREIDMASAKYISAHRTADVVLEPAKAELRKKFDRVV